MALRVLEVTCLKPLLQFLQVIYLLLVSMPSLSSAHSLVISSSTKAGHAGVPLRSVGCLVRVRQRTPIITTRKEGLLSQETALSDSGLALREVLFGNIICPDFSTQQGPSIVRGPRMLSNAVCVIDNHV